MQEKFNTLLDHLHEVTNLASAAALLQWDQATYMPPGGTEARARQLATLQRLRHERFTAPEIGMLLADLESYEKQLDYDSFEAALLRVTRREYTRWQHVPGELIARWAANGSQTHQAWIKARPASDFTAVEPGLERVLEFSREIASYLPTNGNANRETAHVADPLIALSDYGMSALELRRLFAALRAELVPLVEAITAQAPADDTVLWQHFPVAEQLALAREMATQLGYDFTRGRIDQTAHPFVTRFGVGDVRLTTRVREDYLAECLFSTIHETGHALYEQGVDFALDGTALASGASDGLHESQSRLWENLVGHSHGFWEYFFPQLQARFPAQLSPFTLETFYRAISKVQRSLIRTDADEVTYNLHVMLRFDLELDMLEGKLAVHDLPEAWNARMAADLGMVPPNHAQGVMQDVHWYAGTIGGSFQGYTLGNILAAQIYESALRAEPTIPAAIRSGEFGILHGWLRDKLYRHGAKFTAPELIERVTGRPLEIEPYVRYLKEKFGELYGI